MIGVDLSEEMLKHARSRLSSADDEIVELVQADVREIELPANLHTAISTFGMEMVPEYGDVVARVADHLPPPGKFGLMGIKHPETWPEWLVEVGVRLTSRFGVSREYEHFKPWEAAREHLTVATFEEMLGGAAYLCIAEKKVG